MSIFMRRPGAGLFQGLVHAAAALLLAAALPALAAGGGAGTDAKPRLSTPGYDHYLTGDPADAKPPEPTAPMLVLMGGGEDVDEAFRRMIAAARGGGSGKVDVVVLRTSGADGYNPYLAAMDGVDSVETLVLKKADAADDPAVNAIVARADVLFIAGGDQSTYIANWSGTALDVTLQRLLVRGVPFGGTSAGLAVLGDIDYTGENGSITSDTALANPYDRRLTLSTRLLRGLTGLQNTVTDAHLSARDRMGRLVAFLARITKDGLAPSTPDIAARGIGVDEATAVVIEASADGPRATVVGAPLATAPGSAYFLRPLLAADVLAPKRPLTVRNVEVVRLTAGQGGAVNLATGLRSGAAVVYQIDVIGGVPASSQPGGGLY